MFSLMQSPTYAFAIDLGTNNTLVYQPRKGIILEEPTSIAFDCNKRSFFDSGINAKRMVGKNPKYIEIMQPLSRGAISNLTVAKAYIKEVISRISRKSFLKPHIVVSVPSDLNVMERNAVIEAGREGGAKSVRLLKDPFAAALGSAHAIERPQGVLVLDVGAGVSDISLISLNGIVMSKSLRIAGNDLDEAIIEHFKATKRVLISPNEAEKIKQALGSLLKEEEKQMSISVKNLVTRLPKTFIVHSKDVHQAILPIADKIVALTHTMLSELPPVFASDIYDQGILLTGGSSMLKGLDAYLSSRLEIAVNPVENPLHNIILGAGRAIEEARYSTLFGV